MNKKEFIKELKNRGISGINARKQEKIAIAMYGSYEATIESIDKSLKAMGNMAKQMTDMISDFNNMDDSDWL